MILSSLDNTGPGIVAKDLCEQYILKGHECHIFYFDDIFGLSVPCAITKLVKGDEFNPNEWDIVHSHGFRPDFFVAKNINTIRKAKTKAITTLHQPIDMKELNLTYSLSKSIVGSLIWRICLKAFDYIVVLNSITQSSLPQKLRAKSSVVFNGRSITINSINSEDQKFLNDIKRNKKIIGTCSSITKRKGLEQIVKALPSLPDHVFVAVGSGDQMDYLKNLASKLNVSDRCFFLGYRKDSVSYLPYFDYFLMCSRSEGFPLALIEAASQGIPTILSDIPILKAIVTEDIVDFYHLDDINSLINVILSMDTVKGKRLKEFYDNNLTADIMANNYFHLYKNS